MITAPQALAALEAVVAGHEDEVYQEPNDDKLCVYAYNGSPSCVVGCALAHLGIDTETIAALDSANRLGGPILASSLCDTGPLAGHIDADASAVLGAAQHTQDDGETWGYALNEARFRAFELGYCEGSNND